MEKLDYLYSDLKYDLLCTYRNHNKELSNNNIMNFNDYVTDDIIGEEGFKHPLEAFYRELSICLAMVELKLMDEQFFIEISEPIKSYHSGEYDNYFFNKKADKKELDKDIEIVLNYYKDTKK